jgi:hypothetical protein
MTTSKDVHFSQPYNVNQMYLTGCIKGLITPILFSGDAPVTVNNI